MKHFSFIRNLMLCLALMFTTINFENNALAYSTDANHSLIFAPECINSADNGVRYSVRYIDYEFDTFLVNGTVTKDVYKKIASSRDSVIITNYSISIFNGVTNIYPGDPGTVPLADLYNYFDGLYYLDLVPDEIVNSYILGYPPLPDGITVSESHDETGFTVSTSISNEFLFERYGILKETCTIKNKYDGKIIPTSNINNGKDGNECEEASDCTGMPVWSISQPYLNVWAYDTPVFYHTSLGEKIEFRVNYKQRDTRPRDDGIYPTTGWNHNWYSYIHFTINQSDINQWQAILYSPNNTESYFSCNKLTDPENNLTIIPTFSGGTFTRFRVVHGDGSQDIYSLVSHGINPTYGIFSRFGCVYDKTNSTCGPAGMWKPNLAYQTRNRDGQDNDDPAFYFHSSINTTQYISLLDYNGPFETQHNPTGFFAQGTVFNWGDALLTSRIDPYGNAITLGYEHSGAKYRLTTITDYDSNETTISYDANGFSKVEMPYNRDAYFHHDSNGNLTNVIDMLPLESYIFYTSVDGGINTRISSIQTPYGTTSFEYQDDDTFIFPALICFGGIWTTVSDPVYAGEFNVNHKIKVTHPNGAKEIYFYWGSINNGGQIPSSLAVTSVMTNAVAEHGVGSLDYECGDDGISLLKRNCFHWGKRQTPLLSNISLSPTNFTTTDFRNSKWGHYPMEYDEEFANTNLNSNPTFVRSVSMDGLVPGHITWFTYDTQILPSIVSGEPLNRSRVIEMPDGSATVTTYTYDGDGKLIGISEPYTGEDNSVNYRNYEFQYSWVSTSWGSIPYLYYVSTPLGTATITTSPTLTGDFLSWPEISIDDGFNNVTTLFYSDGSVKHRPAGAIYPTGLSYTNTYADKWLRSTYYPQLQITNHFEWYSPYQPFCGKVIASRIDDGNDPDSLGWVSYSYDSFARLTSIRFGTRLNEPYKPTINYIYLGLNLVALKDCMTNFTYAEYNNMRQLTQQTDKRGYSTLYGYASCGALESITDPMQGSTTYLYDNVGNLTHEISSAGTITFNRDALGRVSYFSDLSGTAFFTNTYNCQNLLTKVSGPYGKLFEAFYNSDDTLRYAINSEGLAITNTYDDLKRILSVSTSVATQSFEYSGVFRISSTDNNQNTTHYGYDSAGRLSSITNANNEKMDFNYKGLHLLSVADDQNHTTSWEYDVRGNCIRETNTYGVVVATNEYNANNELIKHWAINRGFSTFDLDPNGNATNITRLPGGTELFDYDGLNRVTMMSNEVGKTMFTYTNFGAFKSGVLSETGLSGIVFFNYTNALLNSIIVGQLSNNWQQTYNYDYQKRLTGVTSPAGNFSMLYKGAGGQNTKITIPGGNFITNQFDSLGNLTSTILKGPVLNALNSHTYSYNTLNQCTNMALLGGVYVSYDYDNIGQLVQAVYHYNTNKTFGYGYDTAGNMAYSTNGTITQVFSNNNANFLASITTGNSTTNYYYDNSGNLVYDGTRYFQYDANSRLVRVFVPLSWRTDYFYDGLSRKVVRKDYKWVQ